MTLGPLEYIAIGFEGNRFNGEIARQSLVVVGKIFTREVKARSALAAAGVPADVIARYHALNSPEARQQRFNALFLLAHKAFILNDREHYVLSTLNEAKP